MIDSSCCSCNLWIKSEIGLSHIVCQLYNPRIIFYCDRSYSSSIGLPCSSSNNSSNSNSNLIIVRWVITKKRCEVRSLSWRAIIDNQSLCLRCPGFSIESKGRNSLVERSYPLQDHHPALNIILLDRLE